MPITRHLERSAVSDLINHPLQAAARQEQARRSSDPIVKQEIIEATISDLAEWYKYRFPDLVADDHIHHVKERLEAMNRTKN